MAKTQAKTRTGTRAKTQAKTRAGTRAKTQTKAKPASRRAGTVVVGDDLIDLIDSVSAEVKSKGLSKVSLEIDGVSLEIANKLEYVGAGLVPQTGVLTRVAPAQSSAAAPAPTPAAAAKAAPDIHLEDVVSPVTGTFYAAPGPGEPAFVKVSDRIKNGDAVCIIEAMKTMNKITSHYDGTVHSIEVENGEVVQTGQVLVRIKP